MATKAKEDYLYALQPSIVEDLASHFGGQPGTTAPAGPQAPTYAGTYEDQLNQLFDKIQNREPFRYDVNADPLYQQYKDKYIQQGKLAMKDTMGQAAGLTGGYGSTYSQQVGQQTYDSYLQNLSDVIPQLYDMSYGMYRDKGNDLLQQYGLVGQRSETEYNRYRDELSDYNYQQELARQQEEMEYNRRINEENTAFSRQQQMYSNLIALIRASGYNPTDQELAEAGLTRAAANALRNEYLRGVTPVISGGGGGGGGGSRSTKTTTQTNGNKQSTFYNDAVARNTKTTVQDVAKTASDMVNQKKINPVQAAIAVMTAQKNATTGGSTGSSTAAVLSSYLDRKKNSNGGGGH